MTDYYNDDDRHRDEPTTLEEISGVSKRKAEFLRDSGYVTVEDVQAATQADLSAIEGIGNALAARMKADVGGTGLGDYDPDSNDDGDGEGEEIPVETEDSIEDSDRQQKHSGTGTGPEHGSGPGLFSGLSLGAGREPGFPFDSMTDGLHGSPIEKIEQMDNLTVELEAERRKLKTMSPDQLRELREAAEKDYREAREGGMFAHPVEVIKAAKRINMIDELLGEHEEEEDPTADDIVRELEDARGDNDDTTSLANSDNDSDGDDDSDDDSVTGYDPEIERLIGQATIVLRTADDLDPQLKRVFQTLVEQIIDNNGPEEKSR